MHQYSSGSAPMTRATCYDNGLKIMETYGFSTTTMTDAFEVKKDGTVCYTRSFLTTTSGPFMMTSIATSATGTTLATTSRDINNVYTVTCPGRPPTVFDASCGFPDTVLTNGYLAPTTTPVCTEGTCAY